jgi:hypothetical protein
VELAHACRSRMGMVCEHAGGRRRLVTGWAIGDPGVGSRSDRGGAAKVSGPGRLSCRRARGSASLMLASCARYSSNSMNSICRLRRRRIPTTRPVRVSERSKEVKRALAHVFVLDHNRLVRRLPRAIARCPRSRLQRRLLVERQHALVGPSLRVYKSQMLWTILRKCSSRGTFELSQ